MFYHCKKIITILGWATLFSSIGCFYSAPVFAVTQKAKQWSALNFSGPLNNSNFIYVLELESRYNFNPNQFETEIIRGGLGYRSSSKTSVWFGYQWNAHNQITGRPQVNRLWQQFEWEIFNREYFTIKSRSRLEERMQQGNSQLNNRLRQQLSFTWPKAIEDKFTPILWEELFFNITKPEWVDTGTLDQNRFFVGISVPITQCMDLEAGYLNQYQFNPTKPQMNHIVSLTLNFKT